MIKKEDSITYAYLSEPPQERKMILVTEDKIVVRLKDHDKIFPLDTVKGLYTDKKVLLFPAIIGGIVCPLFLVAAFNDVGNLWIMMTIAFSGLLALYYGLAGSEAFIIQTKVKEFDFFVDTFNHQLPQFCFFFNQVMLKGRLDHYFCLRISKEEEIQLSEKRILEVGDMGRELITVDEITTDMEDVFVLNSPISNGYKIGYRMIDPQTIRPAIFSSVSLEHLQKISRS